MNAKGSTSADNQNESTEMSWPSVLRIASSDEFHQSFAVAQLALKLWQASKTSNVKSIEKSAPKDFLADAWELIESAREHVLRPQTDVEYLGERSGDRDALTAVISRRDSKRKVLFQELCDPGYESKENVLERYGKYWNVYRSQRGFDKLFWDYWRNFGEKWKDGDQEIGTVWWLDTLDTQGKPRRVDLYETERAQMQTLARDDDAWRKRGELLLDWWKTNGVPPGDFSALAEFRKQRDNRAANFKKKPKRKRRQRLKAR